MFEIKRREKMVERALLVGAYTETAGKEDADDLLNELAELVRTLGVPVVGRMLAYNRAPQARLLVGSGKAEEICEYARSLECDVIIFDNELTPAQQRNWENLSKMTVIDRQEIILDIFGARAQTREAKIQVDLANQRKDRKRAPVPNAAIVGYTNAGKSSLLHRLTGADVLVEDALFATLDTTTRKIDLPNKQPLLLTDTVGFIRKLPHQLVESFNATLEEAVMADFLVHLLDASHPRVLEFHGTTMKVLEDLGTDTKKTITVFNKIDRVTDPLTKAMLRNNHPEALFVSVHTGEGLDLLVEQLGLLVGNDTGEVLLHLPHERSDLMARLHREGVVHETVYEEQFSRIRATVPPRLRELVTPFAAE